MDTRQIEQFITVARFQNMTAAAKELGVSQPSLSQAIKKLEGNLGVQLFDREGKNLVLNEYGRILLRQSDIALRAMTNAVKEIKDIPDTGQRSIRLISRCPMGNVAFVFEKYCKTHPDTIISCLTPAENTLETDYDIELLASSLPINTRYALSVCNEDFVVCVPRKHRLATRESVSLKELANERFVMSSAASDMNSVIEGMFREAGYKPKVSAYVSVFSDIIRMVELGKGICIATNISWFIGVDAEVVSLPISDVNRSRGIYIKWPAQAYLSQTTLDFIYYVCEQFRYFSDFCRLQKAGSLN